MTDAESPRPEPPRRDGRLSAAWAWISAESRFAKTMAVLAVGLAVFSGVLYQRIRDLEDHPEKAASIKQQRLEDDISALFTAPTYTTRENGRTIERTDTPRFTLVTDETLPQFQLSGFREARIGDYIVSYPGAKTALLYREDDDKIIATINDYDGTTKPLVVVFGADGAAGAVEDELLRAFGSNIDIQKRVQRVKGLQRPVVVDVTGEEAEAAQELAEAAGGTVGALPVGVTPPPDAAFVVYAPAR